MIRPLTDADTAFMPELHPATVPIRVARLCGWCEIQLTAVPDQPVAWRDRLYHPSCVDSAQRVNGRHRTDPSGTVEKAGGLP